MATPFSVRLSAILKSRGMSQTDLAAASGLSPAAVNRYITDIWSIAGCVRNFLLPRSFIDVFVRFQPSV